MTEPTENIYHKVTAVIAAIGLIQKDSKAPTGMGGYAFISHGALLGHLRHELTSRNIVIIPSGEEVVRSVVTENIVRNDNGESVKRNVHTVIKFKFTVVNGDDPTDKFEAYWIGEGMDVSDKGAQKAGTSAEKYFLMKLFKVGDKDDPDGATIEEPKTTSESAQLRPAGSPGAFSHRAVAETKAAQNELEKLAEQAGLNNGKTETKPVEVSADDKKKQIDALVWLGEQLPPGAGWFRGKIVPFIQLWESRQAQGKNVGDDALSTSGVDHVYRQIAAAHKEFCKPKEGEQCEHMLVPQMAILFNGRITDPATK